MWTCQNQCRPKLQIPQLSACMFPRRPSFLVSPTEQSAEPSPATSSATSLFATAIKSTLNPCSPGRKKCRISKKNATKRVWGNGWKNGKSQTQNTRQDHRNKQTVHQVQSSKFVRSSSHYAHGLRGTSQVESLKFIKSYSCFSWWTLNLMNLLLGEINFNLSRY